MDERPHRRSLVCHVSPLATDTHKYFVGICFVVVISRDWQEWIGHKLENVGKDLRRETLDSTTPVVCSTEIARKYGHFANKLLDLHYAI